MTTLTLKGPENHVVWSKHQLEVGLASTNKRILECRLKAKIPRWTRAKHTRRRVAMTYNHCLSSTSTVAIVQASNKTKQRKFPLTGVGDSKPRLLAFPMVTTIKMNPQIIEIMPSVVFIDLIVRANPITMRV